MKPYKLFGDNTELSETAQFILNQDITALKKCVENGFDVNKEFVVCRYIEETPLNLALIENKLEAIEFLLEHGAKLNLKDSPPIVTAARNCSIKTIRMLVARGANIAAKNRLGKNAFSAALYSDRYDLLPVLAELGLKVGADEGVSFRQAVNGRQRKAVQFFIDQGIDVNLRKRCQVFPENPTAVSVAARNNDFEMVKCLVSHGADITLKDQYGDRPYSYAVCNKNVEMQIYLKNLEPARWHDEEQRLTDLKGYSVPAGLLEFFRQENRKMILADGDIGHIEFHPLLDVKEVEWKGRKFLDLLSDVDNYSAGGFLVWSPKHKKLASADYEHGEFRVLCKWGDFVAEPAKWIRLILHA